ncbi:hypothetical protein [Phytoactinopolyspora halotolerans]|uniref:Uncharacterized protein n=1 Tax=Phytoactinopolyspora halotolerans TaxID=1981512 RepID=A0A6L9S5Y0_9ACTN|nr:hypothetical protein [Phytoactinopolyspora halotolerans]NED99917.1 hypothetical protein [Phytoactinopolyspora halotolerans]
MNTPDPMFEALDRLARAADSRPAGDPMPGIVRKARANRRRANALVAGGLVAVAAAGFGLSSVVGVPQLSREPGYAETPTMSPSPIPTPTPSRSPSSSPDEPDLGEYDGADADVDGDGAADATRILVPAHILALAGVPEDGVRVPEDVSVTSDDVRLQVEFAAGGTAEVRLGRTLAPTIVGTPDLDGNGTADVVLAFSGGDSGWLKIFTWDDGTVVQAEPADGSPPELVNEGDLFIAPGVASSILADGELISWVDATDPPSDEVRVWTWRLEQNRLVATEADEVQCFSREDQRPRPC